MFRWAAAAKEISQQLELRTKEVKRQEVKLEEAIQAREEAQVTIKHLSRSLVASEALNEKQEKHVNFRDSSVVEVSMCKPDLKNIVLLANKFLLLLE